MRLVASTREIFFFHKKCTSVNIDITNSLNSLPGKEWNGLFHFFPKEFSFSLSIGTDSSVFSFFLTLSLWNSVRQLPIVVLKEYAPYVGAYSFSECPVALARELNLLWSWVTSPPGCAGSYWLGRRCAWVGGAWAGARCELGLPVFPLTITTQSGAGLGPRLLERKPWGLGLSCFHSLLVSSPAHPGTRPFTLWGGSAGQGGLVWALGVSWGMACSSLAGVRDPGCFLTCRLWKNQWQLTLPCSDVTSGLSHMWSLYWALSLSLGSPQPSVELVVTQAAVSGWGRLGSSVPSQSTVSALLREQAGGRVLLTSGVPAFCRPPVSPTSPPASHGGLSSPCWTSGLGCRFVPEWLTPRANLHPCNPCLPLTLSQDHRSQPDCSPSLPTWFCCMYLLYRLGCMTVFLPVTS